MQDISSTETSGPFQKVFDIWLLIFDPVLKCPWKHLVHTDPSTSPLVPLSATRQVRQESLLLSRQPQHNYWINKTWQHFFVYKSCKPKVEIDITGSLTQRWFQSVEDVDRTKCLLIILAVLIVFLILNWVQKNYSHLILSSTLTKLVCLFLELILLKQ